MAKVQKPKIDKSRHPIEYIFDPHVIFRCGISDMDFYTEEELRTHQVHYAPGDDYVDIMSRPRLRYVNINKMVEVFRGGTMPIFLTEDYPKLYEIHIRIFDYLNHMQMCLGNRNTKLPLADLRLLNEFDKEICKYIPEYLADDEGSDTLVFGLQFGSLFADKEMMMSEGIAEEEVKREDRTDFTDAFGKYDWMGV